MGLPLRSPWRFWWPPMMTAAFRRFRDAGRDQRGRLGANCLGIIAAANIPLGAIVGVLRVAPSGLGWVSIIDRRRMVPRVLLLILLGVVVFVLALSASGAVAVVVWSIAALVAVTMLALGVMLGCLALTAPRRPTLKPPRLAYAVTVGVGDIPALAEDIDRLGLLQPVGVWRQADGRLRLVWGHRRLEAHRHLGRPTFGHTCETTSMRRWPSKRRSRRTECVWIRCSRSAWPRAGRSRLWRPRQQRIASRRPTAGEHKAPGRPVWAICPHREGQRFRFVQKLRPQRRRGCLAGPTRRPVRSRRRPPTTRSARPNGRKLGRPEMR